MTLLQLRYFQVVCQYDSVSKAAEILHVSQPALSIAIKELEEEFGVSLFTRQKKRLVLTTEGAFFLDKAKEILSQADSLSRLMSDMGHKTHTLNVGLISISGINLFLDSLHRFRDLYPDIQISIKECNSAQATESVLNNSCTASIIIADAEKPDALDGLVLLRTKYVFCVGKTHPMAGSTECDLRQLKDQSLILFQDETYLTRELKHRFYQLGISPKVLLYTMNFPLIRKLISAGKEGIFLTREAATLLPDVVQIPLSEPIQIAYALVWRKKSSLNGSLSKLIEVICQDYPNAEPYR